MSNKNLKRNGSNFNKFKAMEASKFIEKKDRKKSFELVKESNEITFKSKPTYNGKVINDKPIARNPTITIGEKCWTYRFTTTGLLISRFEIQNKYSKNIANSLLSHSITFQNFVGRQFPLNVKLNIEEPAIEIYIYKVLVLKEDWYPDIYLIGLDKLNNQVESWDRLIRGTNTAYSIYGTNYQEHVYYSERTVTITTNMEIYDDF